MSFASVSGLVYNSMNSSINLQNAIVQSSGLVNLGGTTNNSGNFDNGDFTFNSPPLVAGQKYNVYVQLQIIPQDGAVNGASIPSGESASIDWEWESGAGQPSYFYSQTLQLPTWGFELGSTPLIPLQGSFTFPSNLPPNYIFVFVPQIGFTSTYPDGAIYGAMTFYYIPIN
jgi:hypothetical protein